MVGDLVSALGTTGMYQHTEWTCLPSPHWISGIYNANSPPGAPDPDTVRIRLRGRTLDKRWLSGSSVYLALKITPITVSGWLLFNVERNTNLEVTDDPGCISHCSIFTEVPPPPFAQLERG